MTRTMDEFLNWLLIFGLVWLAMAASWPAHAQQQRSFYDRNGSFVGSSSQHGNQTSFTDRSGRFDGTVIRNSNGTTSAYDARGHFVGSSASTGRPK